MAQILCHRRNSEALHLATHSRTCRKEKDSRKSHHKRQRKDSDKHKSSKSASKLRRVSGEGHDWGNTQPKAKERTAVPKAVEQKPTFSASEVPEAFRAQIKAMLGR